MECYGIFRLKNKKAKQKQTKPRDLKSQGTLFWSAVFNSGAPVAALHAARGQNPIAKEVS